MPKVTCFCDSCESNFTVKHDLDPSRYPVITCPFCGSDLEGDEMQDVFSEEGPE